MSATGSSSIGNPAPTVWSFSSRYSEHALWLLSLVYDAGAGGPLLLVGVSNHGGRRREREALGVTLSEA